MDERILLGSVLLVTSATLMADQPGYRLSIESSLQDRQLVVSPRISAPPGAQLRYEMVSTKLGAAGKSHTTQSGRVAADPAGSAALSTLRLGVAAGDRYDIVVKVYDGQELVAEQALRHPK